MIAPVDFPPVNHIEIREGQARLVGRPLKVKMVISRLLHGQGATVDKVMEQYGITRAEVLACLVYYADHRAQIDAHFDQMEAAVHNAAVSLDDLIARLRRELQSPDKP